VRAVSGRVAAAAAVAGLVLAALLPPGAAGPTTAVRVDQVGYRPRQPKLALVAGAPATFAVKDARTGAVVFEGRPSPPAARPDPASGDRVAALDFTPLATPGTYVVSAAGSDPSPAFAVAEDVYAGVLAAVLRVFTYQRCGAGIREGSPWARPACHLRDAREWGGGPHREATGGWHDAGDYGKYVPAAGITIWHLAAVHDLAPAPWLLDELRWELDWLLRMQRSDGGVHHKVTGARWTGNYAPHHDPDPRWLFAVSSAATANLAAAGARAARLFRPHDGPYAARLLAAAESAWQWLDRHRAIVPPGGFRNPAGAETGEYEDDDDRDERFWAAAELWRTTGAARYREAVLAGLGRWTPFDYPPSWQRVQNLAYLGLVEADSPLDPAAVARLRAGLAERSGWLLDAYATAGYRVALAPGDYYAGSNGIALGRAVQLLAAHRVTGRAAFRDAALDQVHYVLGRNALGKSFLTGFGSDPVRRPTHQPSLTHPGRLVLPGLLVGGPNAQANGLPAPFPARAYRDDAEVWGVNEPAIYWQAALAHVLAHLAAPD
jgi:endoglucanase